MVKLNGWHYQGLNNRNQPMRYEIIETGGQWIVECDGVEISRHADQAPALEDVTERLRASRLRRAVVAMHFEKPAC
jgi:hypothetical protein